MPRKYKTSWIECKQLKVIADRMEMSKGPAHGGLLELPSELLQEVFSRLDPVDLAKLRLVCREWSSSTFLQQELQAGLATSGPWVHLKRSFSTDVCYCLKSGSQVVMQRTLPDGFGNVQYSGSLAYAYNSKNEAVVGNPLTNNWRHFEPPLVPSSGNIAMVTDPAGGFKLFIWTNMILFMHDSKSPGLWQLCDGNSSAEPEQEQSGKLPGVILTTNSSVTWEVLKSFDPQERKWWKLEHLVQELQEEDDPYWAGSRAVARKALKCEDRIFMASSIHAPAVDHQLVGYSIWELHEASSTWKLASRFKLRGDAGGLDAVEWNETLQVKVDALRERVLFTVRFQGENGDKFKWWEWCGAWPAVVYNLETEVWSTVSHPGVAFSDGHIFVPSLTACP